MSEFHISITLRNFNLIFLFEITSNMKILEVRKLGKNKWIQHNL